MSKQKSEITLQIEVVGGEDILPLYTEYQGQSGKAYLYLDTRDGEVYLRGKHSFDNGVSGDEAAGHIRSWEVPNDLTVAGCNELLADPAITDRLKQIMAGAEEYYDGSNFRTRLSEDARDVSDDLELYLNIQIFGSHYDTLEVRSADNFLSLVGYSRCVRDGESHEEAAERIVAEALAEGYYLIVADVVKVLGKKQEKANTQQFNR